MRPVATIDASQPRADREFAADMCEAWGIDSNRICRISYYYDPATHEGIIEFWGFEVTEGMWAHEENAPRVHGLVSSPLREELIRRVKYTIDTLYAAKPYPVGGQRL